MKKFAWFLAAGLALAAPTTGCFMSQGNPLTPVEVQSNGSHDFSAEQEHVFKATAAALEGQGYKLILVDQEHGHIKTGQKLVRAMAQGSYSSAVAIEATRQYDVRLVAEGGKTRVTATPRVFMGSTDVSDGPVWDLEGPAGERALWAQLFKEIDSNLK